MLLRNKLRQIKGGCADCGAPDPAWASMNRGILICDDCCSVHRSLGRHISQVKSLKRGFWNAQQLKMVHNLADSGANNIWEHSLLDPSHGKLGRRKPAPTDPVHPNKAKFVRDKHQMLAFVYRPGKDDRQLAEGDTSLQLHSSVRTPNTETSLRLLSLGANPNYWHPERGTGPLHVAARAGQALQAELLMVYGADPIRPDRAGLTPIQHAREAGHLELCRRLEECQYELTDRLAYFVTGRRPDHAAEEHFLVPPPPVPPGEPLLAARRKLQALPSRLLAELAADVYDEVDRRETDALWLAQHPAATSGPGSVPFLPVNPEFSSTRNQGRQKLARFNATEFRTLVVDILQEARRRLLGPAAAAAAAAAVATVRASAPADGSDDEPLYDSVASEEDYAPVEQQERLQRAQQALAAQRRPTLQESLDNDDSGEMPAKDSSSSSLEGNTHRRASDASGSSSGGGATGDHSDNADRGLLQSNQQLQEQNDEMQRKIDMLRAMVARLASENSALRATSAGSSGSAPLPPSGRNSQRPVSMFETRDRPAQPAKWCLECNNSEREGRSPVSDSSAAGSILSSSGGGGGSGSRSLPHETPSRHSGSRSLPLPGGVPSGAQQPPKQETVIRKTEQVTRRIQRLLTAAQSGRTDQYNACIDRIYSAVLDMVAVFPQSGCDERTVESVQQLSTSAWRLQHESANLLASAPSAQPGDARAITQQVIQMAFEVAKGAKQLVMIYQ